ncbi:MAG: hypothetical protein Q3M24_13415 [Candidatus Electrothrix aestuarii]|uniref:Uncharacterized protein n=1 Tax=Candidatus Electrothrix aestuarii TaxID=3062594 RepID=A0AAU8LQ36_9BACT|nr:hypothetical protein [Candidatus Electrothrix aestuarii]WPD24677.1 MAG: hypothetical protein SD837_08960 [Candidatus Electrothrix sp. GW3-3]
MPGPQRVGDTLLLGGGDTLLVLLPQDKALVAEGCNIRRAEMPVLSE